MRPRGDAISLPGEQTKEPTFGLPAMWVDESLREDALFKAKAWEYDAVVLDVMLPGKDGFTVANDSRWRNAGISSLSEPAR